MAKIPDQDETLVELQGLLSLIWSALDSAILETREFFDSRNRPTDRPLAPCLVRYHTKLFLAKEGQNVEDEEIAEVGEYDLVPVPNNGLYLEYGRYRIRILKSDGGELPVPGISRKRQDFWNQTQLDMFGDLEEADDETANEIPINLIVLWDVSGNYNLDSLHLTCPQSGGTTKESVSDYWTILVPNPVMVMKPTLANASPHEDDDIGITLKTETKKRVERI